MAIAKFVSVLPEKLRNWRLAIARTMKPNALPTSSRDISTPKLDLTTGVKIFWSPNVAGGIPKREGLTTLLMEKGLSVLVIP